MQKAAWYNMPIAVAVAKLWSDYTTLPMQVKSSFFWWQPDPTFLSLDASRILFPPQDRSAQRRGIFLTSSEDVPIEKYASIDLQALAPTVYELLKALNIDMIVVNKLMSDRMDAGDSAEDVACRWLKANQGRTFGKAGCPMKRSAFLSLVSTTSTLNSLWKIAQILLV